jgi:outer membrane protein assembly factor BamA
MNIMNVMNKISLMKYFWFTVILLFTYSVPQDSFSQSLIIEEIKIVHKDTKSFDDDILISALGVNESDAFESSVLSSNIYKLQKFYFDNGFFDAKIDTALRYDPDEKEVFIDIIIYENEHFRIDTLRYTGIGNISENAEKLLSKINTTAEGQYYDRSEISQQGNEITDMLQNNGYMNARIKPDSGIVIKRYAGVSPNKLSVYINFTGADTVFYFGKTGISISDNKYGVDKELLEEEIEYEKDEIYSKEKLLESEGNMTKVPIVQSARIKPDKINNNKVDFISEIILNDKTEIGPYAKAIVIDNVFYAGGEFSI